MPVKINDARGRKYSQEKLEHELAYVTAGQSKLTKLIIVCLLTALGLVFTFISSFLGAGIIFRIVAETRFQLVFLLVIFVTFCWLISTFIWSLNKGFIVSTLISIVSIVCLQLLEYLGVIKLIPEFLISVIGNIVVQLAVCSATFLVGQFIIASIEILYLRRSGLVKILIFLIIIFASISSSLSAFSDGFHRQDLNLQEKLLRISSVELEVLKTVSVLGGLSLISSLIVLSWIVNRRKQVPWFYPNLIRDLALSVGSWRGTSFYGLDLSNINFSGARLANTDLRAEKLYRTCFQGVVGLERARANNQYLDLAYPKVQKLLTQGSSPDPNFSKFNLQGTYLQNADMRGFDLTDTNLMGSDLKGADLRGSRLIRTQLAGADLEGVDLRTNILIDANLTEANLRGTDLRDCIFVRAQVARADFSEADLTGICIEDWSVSSKTRFTDVRCDYIYRRYQDGHPADRYPINRNFEPSEFSSLFQQPENELELVFKGEFDYTALSLTFDKLQTDKPDLKLKLQGIEQRQDLWVVKVISDAPAIVESRIQEIQDAVYQGYEVTTTRLENNPLIRRIISDVANIRKTQEETVEEVKQLAKRIGSNFYFLGGTITNVTGAGEINYTEASNQVRSLVSSDGHQTQVANTLLSQLRSSNVATTATEQVELIQFVILEEAQRDPRFRQSLLQQEQQILASLPESSIASAIRGAIAQLNQS